MQSIIKKENKQNSVKAKENDSEIKKATKRNKKYERITDIVSDKCILKV